MNKIILLSIAVVACIHWSFGQVKINSNRIEPIYITPSVIYNFDGAKTNNSSGSFSYDCQIARVIVRRNFAPIISLKSYINSLPGILSIKGNPFIAGGSPYGTAIYIDGVRVIDNNAFLLVMR